MNELEDIVKNHGSRVLEPSIMMDIAETGEEGSKRLVQRMGRTGSDLTRFVGKWTFICDGTAKPPIRT